ncbi:MAG: hypothetical protein PUB10_01970 [Clostridiales bacterium]|nr:hypothetical protein [Clostridiales bacterium]
MKWFKRGAIVLCLTCAATMWHADPASAQTFTDSKTYEVDLNGDGKKENIKWVGKKDGEKYSVKVYVNGKKLSTATSNYGSDAQVSVVDIDKEDKKKDIYVQITSESDGFEKGFGYQYQKGKLKKTFTFDQPATGRLSIEQKQPGDGCVWFDSEYGDSYFMQGYVKQAYEITAGKLKPVNKKIMNTTTVWRKTDYKATKTLKVYADIGDSTPSFNLSSKTTFNVYKIKASNPKALLDGVSYIYIKTADGKTGWIKNPKKVVIMGKTPEGDWSTSVLQWG